MSNSSTLRRARIGGIAGLATVALALSGCAADSGATSSTDSNPEGEGVAYGASLEEYHAAFADIEPITLKFQTSGPEGSLANQGLQSYADAIEEYSDGKITFEWGHSNGFVPSATEWNIGFNDGRIDVGLFLPYYNPDIFPELNNLTSATFLDGNAPNSTFISAGWLTEALYEIPAYQEEAHANGVHVLGLGPSVSVSGIFCNEDITSLAAFDGAPISASGSGRVAQLTALGFSPQSIAFTELYEALERGIVECGSSVPTAIQSAGAVDLVPYAIADPEVALTGFPSLIAISAQQWDSLPLVAQQLFVDQFGVYLKDEGIGQGQRVTDWLDQAIAAGGGIKPFDDDARAALQKANDALVDDLESQGTDVKTIQSLFDKWKSLVNDDIYPDNSDNLEEFLLADGYADLDYQPFIDTYYDEILLEQRPE